MKGSRDCQSLPSLNIIEDCAEMSMPHEHHTGHISEDVHISLACYVRRLQIGHVYLSPSEKRAISENI